MAGEDSAAGRTHTSGLLGSIRHLAATLVEVAHTRLRLLANELEEEKLRLGQLLLFAALAALFFGLTILFLTLLVVVLFWDDNRVLVLSIIVGVYLLLGIVFGAMARKRAGKGSRLFAASLRELAEDGERLS